MIYLDHAATTPLRPEAREAWLQGVALWANPSSPHAPGRRARAALEDARERVKAALDWDGEVIFTSGATEALQIALTRAKADRQVVSAVEHDAVFRTAPDAEILPVASDWIVDRERLATALGSGGRPVIAIQHVNSETGAIQPVSELAAQIREGGGLLVSDCSQSAGKFELPDADMVVVSGHKLGAPIGVGALLVRDFAMLEPSGGQERGYRAGTENLSGALGFAAALESRGMAHKPAGQGVNTRSVAGQAQWLVPVTSAFHDIEHATYSLGGKFQIGPGSSDLSILAITMPKVSAAAQLIQFDAAGFAISIGSACSSGTLKPSRTLLAFGLDESEARNTIRMSAGWTTSYDDILAFSQVWEEIAARAAKGI